MKKGLFFALLVLTSFTGFAYAQDDLETSSEEIVAPVVTPIGSESMDTEMPSDSSSIYIPEESSENSDSSDY